MRDIFISSHIGFEPMISDNRFQATHNVFIYNVGIAGLELALSCSQSKRINLFSYTPIGFLRTGRGIRTLTLEFWRLCDSTNAVRYEPEEFELLPPRRACYIHHWYMTRISRSHKPKNTKFTVSFLPCVTSLADFLVRVNF